jgi:hypothetical protein
MTPIPVADERVQGTQPEGYFGLSQWLQGTGHLICLKVTLSQNRLQILHLLRILHIVLRDLCSQQLLSWVVHVLLSSLPVYNITMDGFKTWLESCCSTLFHML